MRSDDEKFTTPEAKTRLRWSTGLAVGVVLAATFAVPTYAQMSAPTTAESDGGQAGTAQRGADALSKQHRADSANTAGALADPGDRAHEHGTHDHAALNAGAGADGHGHDHSDATTKNAVSRSTEPGAEDPTTARQATASANAVADQRAEPDPNLVPVPAKAPRRSYPEDRYAMAGGCYALQSTATGSWVQRYADGFRASASGPSRAESFRFQATDLGKYLLYGTQQDFVAKKQGDPAGLLFSGKVVADDGPSTRSDWTATQRGSSYRFSLPDAGQKLAIAASGDLVLGDTADPFTLRRTTGCASWPEVQTNITGRPHGGETAIQEVRGYLDAHTHGMAFEFLGGEVHCGRPWHPYGVESALVDCEDHQAANGRGAALENILNDDPSGEHDPVGWPTFKDWPAPDSLTHEGTYYKWMERAYRGGQRLFVNLLVENSKLCELYPLKRNSCDDMDSIRLQAQRMREFERYIDAQSGGPGEGWYRIVTDPFQARKAINDGKMAVIMGIETSVVFGCTMKKDVPQCDKESIDRQLDEVYDLGVRQMELVNKFDNALSGVAGDEGTTGAAVNGANFAETGSFWAMRNCSQNPEGVHDKEQPTAPSQTPEQDALFGAIAENYGTSGAAPVYPSGPHCNKRGLTDLGDHTVREMVKRKMILDPDHMSVAGRQASLDLVESLDYPGVVSSHSWSTPDAYPRIYKLGGLVAPYAGDSAGFVDKWRKHLGWADDRYYFGFGFGADMNGLGAQGDPRGADAPNPVTYPFKGIGGVTVAKQRSGQRVYDINVDGVAHYGLYPDWMEDLRKQAGNAIVEDMERGPEAYLQMWERSVGVSGDGCRDAAELNRVGVLRGLPRGATAKQVLLRAGQPNSRLGDTFTYCARSAGKTTKVKVVFNDRGRLARTT